MGKRYIFTGLVFSVLLHTYFMRIPDNAFDKQKEIKQEIKQCAVVAQIPDEIKQERIDPVPIEPPKEEPKERENSPKELFKPDSVKEVTSSQEQGDIKIEEPSKEYLPALKMDISDYEALTGAIRYFGMRIVLINSMGNFVDEIQLGTRLKVVPIQQALSEFSNRIRILPLNYFGIEIERIIRVRDLTPCMLVPADIDKRFADLQRQAIEKEGHFLDEVEATGARFKKDGKEYKLVIEKLYLKDKESKT